LAYKIIHSPKLQSNKILLIDKRFKTENDKTWCFWTKSRPPFPEIIHSSWQKFEFGDPKGNFEQHMGGYAYHMIQSQDFYKHILEALKKIPQVEFLETEIDHIGEDDHGAYVTCNQQKIRGGWIFNSGISTIEQEGRYFLKQHFRGQWIKSKVPVFNSDSMVLMDFDVAQLDSPCFMYLLPTSDSSALVEFTSFSKNEFKPEVYFDEIKKYLEKRYPGHEFEIQGEEAGVIPMTDTIYRSSLGSRILNIGTPGGAVKPTTGYAFLNIQKQVSKLIDFMENPGKNVDLSVQRGRFAFYDKLLLHLLENQEDQAWKIFSELFRNSPPALIFKFLEEKTNLFEEAKIFLRLPVSLFLKALYTVHFQRQNGTLKSVPE
jgi:lycopene beta-cyclase